MDDSGLVCALESAGQLGSDIDGSLHRKVFVLQPILEGLSLVVSHRDEQLALVRFSYLVDRADVWVIQRRGGLRLLDESSLGVFVGGQVRREEFQGGRPVQYDVACTVHDTHSAAAKLLDDLEVRYGPADHGHRSVVPSGYTSRTQDRLSQRSPDYGSASLTGGY